MTNKIPNMMIIKEIMEEIHRTTEFTALTAYALRCLCKSGKVKITATVKGDLRAVIKAKNYKFKAIAKEVDISETTLFEAVKIGVNIKKEIAERLCNYLNVPLLEYFEVKTTEVKYALGTNQGIKVMLHTILAFAIFKGKIKDQINVADTKLCGAVSGRATDKKEIFANRNEIQTFIKFVEAEEDLRKKAAFLIYICLGLRTAEVAGLTWSAINFDTGTVAILQNTIYAGKDRGTITKGTKTASSKRVVSAPKALMGTLREYKEWWDNEKISHGNLWEHTDKLFVQNNGDDMNGMTLRNWLRDFQKKHRLKNVTPHGLRHTNTTMLITSGVDIKTMSARLGHATPNITLKTYSHYTSEADRNIADKTAEILYS